MDSNLKKPTNNAGNVSNSPKTSMPRMSAEEKLNKSMKNLSHISGGASGASGARLNSFSSYNSASSTAQAERKKVGGVVLDLETIQEANKQKFDNRGRRNNIIIIILSLLLVVSLVYLIVAIISYKNGKRDPNCKFVVSGDANAKWLVEGGTDTEFVLANGLSSGEVYVMKSVLKIDTTDSVMVTIEINVWLNDEPILVYGLHEGNDNLVRVENTNKYIYQTTITGGGEYHMFDGVDFSETPSNLTSQNIKIEVVANVNKM